MAKIIPNNNNDDEVANENEGPLKKGPWTPEEDAILSAYVRRFGEGNWNVVQKNSGLSRCGKSCRLRWANHLRPNLKKGAFSEEEEKIIVDLHSKIGNKWSQMATQLPGRTDNEIKNFWNTRMKRHQRASLPIYPLEVLQEAYLYHGQGQEHQYFEQQPYQMPPLSVLASLYTHSGPIPSNYYSASAPAPAPVVNPPLPLPLTSNNVYYNIPSLNLPSPSFSLFGSSSSASSHVFNNGQSLSFGAPHHHGSANSSFDYQYSGSLSFNHGINNNNVESMNIPLHPLLQGSSSLSQSPPNSSLTPTSSYASGGGGVDGFMGASSNMVGNEYFEVAPFSSPQGNSSGLLDAIVLEGQSLSARNKKPRREDSTAEEEEAERIASHKRKRMVVEENAEGSTSALPVAVESALKDNTGETGHSSNETLISSSGKKPIDTDPSFDEISWDDDLSSFLNNFPPVEMPMPEWYSGEEIQSPGIETQPHAPPPPSGPGPTNEAFSSGTLTTCWDNMPNIC